MADIDIDPFRGHNKTDSRPDENIPLTPGEGEVLVNEPLESGV